MADRKGRNFCELPRETITSGNSGRNWRCHHWKTWAAELGERVIVEGEWERGDGELSAELVHHVDEIRWTLSVLPHLLGCVWEFWSGGEGRGGFVIKILPI